MTEELDWKELSIKIEDLLRLRTFVLGFNFLKKENIKKISNVHYPRHRSLICQLITTARIKGLIMGCTEDNLIIPNCGSIFGLNEVHESIRSGSMFHNVWFKDIEDCQTFSAQMVRIPSGKHQALLISPLNKIPMKPDIVAVYGNPAQINLLVNGFGWKSYKRMKFYHIGESSCSDGVPNCYMTGELSVALPCFGERRFAGVMDDEILAAMQPKDLPKIIDGLEELKKRMIKYPIPLHGISESPLKGLPKQYLKISDAFIRDGKQNESNLRDSGN